MHVLLRVNVSWVVSDVFKYLTTAPENLSQTLNLDQNCNFLTGVCKCVCLPEAVSCLPIRLSPANCFQQVEMKHMDADTQVIFEIKREQSRLECAQVRFLDFEAFYNLGETQAKSF